ncbi:hypothetical protein BKA56DRAFT_583658 [Ilyonectria sp. MPI-CAGE-AT-0026]|nr:hypothetical protein BKA56DRAFT_583658 [Ilyonectria sp. MPI-CAGE-AT-0026]
MSFGCTDTNQALHYLSRIRAEAISEADPLASNNVSEYRSQIQEGWAAKIPSPSVFDFDQQPDLEPTKTNAPPLPSIAELATHLELLETLHLLRQRILSSNEIDNAFDISPQRLVKEGRRGVTKTLKDDTLWERRQVKWTRFVEFAVVRFLNWKENLQFPLNREDVTLPPLDILMVWHAFLLNPQLFYQHCRDESFYWVRVPWESVHSAIDNLEWNYVQSGKAETNFQDLTGLSAELCKLFSTWIVDRELAVAEKVPYLSQYSLEREQGDASLNLEDTAPAKQSIPSGTPHLENEHTRLPSAQHAITEEMSYTAAVYHQLFRKYGEGDGGLALQLRDAVLRQCDFVDKMNKLLWIRSPALPGTLRRATARYEKFLTLIQLQPKVLAVPTLDIDLVWHTHQCTAGFYVETVRKMTGNFVNHDDKIGKEPLADGFLETRKLFKFYFMEEYDRCGCWECECLLEQVEQAVMNKKGGIDMDVIARNVEDEVTFHREMEVAIRTKAL